MKKYNVYKILGFVLILVMLLSYFIPTTTIGYGTVTKGTAVPIGFADTFLNSLTSISAFAGTLVYLVVIGIFYKILTKTGKLNAAVDKVASKYQNNKSLYIALVVLILGLVTAITGELFSMIIFVPFIFLVLEKLGYSKSAQISTTIGSIILGFSGSMYTFYANQLLSTTFEDNLVYKILIVIISLISLLVFILIFNKPTNVEIKKEEKEKLMPIKVIMIVLLLFVILGFIPWSTYFKFDGFDEFLETLKSAKLFKISVFDALIGQMAQPFGSFQLYNMSVLILFFGLVLALIYKVKFDELLESIAEGIKKSVPYVFILIIAYLILINSYQMFYTIAIDLTKKINLSNIAFTSIVSSILLPDASYATQFTLTALTSSIATENSALLVQVVFQTIYSLCLLVSPTSILILIALRFNNINYKSWIKYIYKFFIILFVIDLLILSVATKAKSLGIIILSVLLIMLLIVLFLKKSKQDEVTKVEVKKETTEEKRKEEVKKVQSTSKKNTTSKSTNSTKKNTKAKSNSSKSKNKKSE